MRIYSGVASCCLALLLVAVCTLLTGCGSSTLTAADYDQVAKECADQFLSSMPEGQRVLIDPQLSNHEYAPLTLRSVERKLTQLEDKAGGKIRFRVIAKQINAPATVTLRKYQSAYQIAPATYLSPLMLEKAKRSDSFPDDNYVFVMLTRYHDDVQSTSMETTCSPELLAAYPNLVTLLARGTTGNTQQQAERFLPNPADEAVLLIARTVTDEVARVEKGKSEQEAVLRKVEEQEKLAEEAKRAQQERLANTSNAVVPVLIGLLLCMSLALVVSIVWRGKKKPN